MGALALQRIRDASLLVQRLGPYLLIEILLPGGTLLALLLFVYRRRQRPGADASPLVAALARLTAVARSSLEGLPVGGLAALVDDHPERDGLEPLAMAPV